MSGLRLVTLLERMPRHWVFPVGGLLLALIGFLDYEAGYFMSLSLFYLLPICLVAAKTGRRNGILISLLGAGVLCTVEGLTRPAGLTVALLAWNVALRWGFFFLIVLGLTALQDAFHKAEEGRQHTEQHLHAVVANSPIVLIAVDVQGLILVHEGKGRLTPGPEQDHHEFIGKNLFEVCRDQPRLLDDVRRALTGEELTESLPGHGGRTFEVRYSPMRDERGQVTGAIIVGTDISEHIQLVHAQKMEAVGRLASGLAHDYNNLMVVVGGYARRLLRNAQEGTAFHDGLTEIARAEDRATALTRQLLTFSRKQARQPAPLSLNVVITDMLRMLYALLGEDVKVELSLSPESFKIIADRSEIEQSIMNLAANARDAMPRGGTLLVQTSEISIAAEAGARRPEVSPGDYVALTIADTGCGMDERTRSRLFEPFFTTKPAGLGTGLGLSTVYGIVRQNGGSIEVRSELGKGTRFTILLPRAAEGKAESPAAAPAAVGAHPEVLGGSETILFTEDHDSIRQLASLELRELGYTVLEGRNAKEALALAQRHQGPIHLLLTDIILPDRSGPELAAALTAQLPEARVLYTSGYTESQLAQRGMKVPASALLEKPFTTEALALKVRAALEAPAENPARGGMSP